MIVKFETEKGFKLVDDVASVEHTPEVTNEKGNEVSTPFDPSRGYNWERTMAPSDGLIPTLIGESPTEEDIKATFCVDDKFFQDERGNFDMQPRLIFIEGTNRKLRIYYTEARVYILNDNGKTIDTI